MWGTLLKDTSYEHDELFHPPLSLRDISPSRGEISQTTGFSIQGYLLPISQRPLLISPLEGEMSAQTTEGAEFYQ